MHFQFMVTALSLLSLSAGHGHHKNRKRANVVSTPQALNDTPTNLIPNVGPGGKGPTLYYNGTGPVPGYNETSPDPASLRPLSTDEIEDNLYNEIVALVSGDSGLTSACDQCIASTELFHVAALTLPTHVITDLLIRTCEIVPAIEDSIYAQTCYEEFSGIGDFGPYYAQLFAKMSAATGDYQAWCYFWWGVCEIPETILVDESRYFTPKPANKTTGPAPSGETFNVLHLTDFHLDPRYDIGSEANCSDYMCCRPYSVNEDLNTVAENASVPASRWGYLWCDAPADLGLSIFSTMDQFVSPSSIAFSLYTGDLVSHDDDDQLSRAYVEYTETIIFQTFKAQLGNAPVFATLGNHDTLPYGLNSPNWEDEYGQKNVFSWNYDLLSSLWSEAGWLSNDTATYASNHYAAYATVTKHGLKIISIDTEFWYISNFYNYANYTNPDPSGILKFLADELQKSEDIGQRAWIIGHVPSGYDGSDSLPNPTALFYSIVSRFSPSTIAGIFFGHNHEDQLSIYYDFLPESIAANSSSSLRNTSAIDLNNPLSVAFLAPSITPLSGLNSGWRMLEVDAKTFEVVNMQTYFANISESNSWTSPVWQLEYDTLDIYDPEDVWPLSAPINATFWHGVTERMLTNDSLVETYNFYETKGSIETESCSTQACVEQKVCYIRSGSAAQGQACPQDEGPF